jgi:hypothetical protein
MFLPGTLHLVDTTTGEERRLDDGPCFGACFSPDGERIAYCKEGSLFVANRDGSGKEEITLVTGNQMMNWTDSDHLYFTQRGERQLYRVHLQHRIREVVFRSEHYYLNSISVSRDGKRAAWSSPTYVHGQPPTWCVRIWDLPHGKVPEQDLGEGAQGTVSPSGAWVTRRLPDGLSMALHRFGETEPARVIAAPQGKRFSFQRFSHNSDGFFVYTIEGEREGYLYDLRNDTTYPVAPGVVSDFYAR